MNDKNKVTYGTATVYVRPRDDGRWVVYWREAQRPRQTTLSDEKKAKARALKEAQRIHKGQGGRMLTIEDAHLVDRVKSVAGNESAFSWLSRAESLVKDAGSWDVVEQAVKHWKKAGFDTVERVEVSFAVNRFLLAYENSDNPSVTISGLRKEIRAFADANPGMAVMDIETDHLEAWIERPKKNGSPPGKRFFNNRLATWGNFLGRCREWGYLVKGEPHPAEPIKQKKLDDKAPEIWSVATAAAALAAVQQEKPRLLPFLVIGGWCGLRPGEIRRLDWTAWDWEGGYVDIGAPVAAKVREQRFLPIHPNVRAMLKPWYDALSEKDRLGKCTFYNDRSHLSSFLRAKKIITIWPQDVLRHSYISYRIADGVSKHEVAEEAGNSESVIRKHYRRPLKKEAGAAWFKLV
ncbi:MAG: hypothetical protein V4672_13180 [Verrucomicrobiota bacterium]